MIKSYLVTSLRSLAKNKIFSFINILGLSIGITAFLLIIMYVQNEFSYDEFHTNKENLYRIQQNRYDNGELSTQWAAGNAGIGPDLKANFPEVKEYVKMHSSNGVVAYQDKVFQIEDAYFSTEAFFDFFSIPLIEATDTAVLARPYTVALSESSARKYFGDEDPLGKTLKYNGKHDFEVTAVFEDIPYNSHMAADMLFSFETYVDLTSEESRTNWNWDGFYTYILLEPGSSKEALEAKLPEFIRKTHGEDLAQWNAGVEFNLQPLTDIHLTSDYMMEFKPNGDKDATIFLLIIAIFLILIAWINYINLSTAKSFERAREIGIRKVLGSFRIQLVKQFLTESFLLNTTAIILSVGFVYLLIPSFSDLSGRRLSFNLYDPLFLSVIIGLWIAGGILAGLYPAFVLSSFAPLAVLKGKFIKSTKGAFMRKGLVIFQFFASIVLIAGTYTVFSQLNYMKSKDLGVDIEQTLVLTGPNVTDSLYSSKFNTFKQELTRNSQIKEITASTDVPGKQPQWNAGGIRLVEQEDADAKQYRVLGVDYDFIDTYGLSVIHGRQFDQNRSNEEKKVLLNESAARMTGYEDFEELLNHELYFWGDTFQIVGVLKDYHQESLKKSFEPLIFRLIPNTSNFYSIKVDSENMSETIMQIQEEWSVFFPGNPFNYFFLDDHYNEQYKAEVQFGKVFGIFATLAIFIACLGLFGLASYMTIQRTKEIGIRKVLGATLLSIMKLLSKDFSKLILISILLAVPVIWLVMSSWLEGFAYRISLTWWIMAVPAVVVLLVAIFTISLQTLKVAGRNPVDTLRSE